MEPFIRLSIPISWCVKIERSLRLQVVRVSGYYETLSSFCMNSVIGFGWLDESPSAIWGNRKPVFWNFKQRNKLKNKIMFITCLEIHFSVVWYNTTDIKLNFGCLLWSKDTSRERVWRHTLINVERLSRPTTSVVIQIRTENKRDRGMREFLKNKWRKKTRRNVFSYARSYLFIYVPFDDPSCASD